MSVFPPPFFSFLLIDPLNTTNSMVIFSSEVLYFFTEPPLDLCCSAKLYADTRCKSIEQADDVNMNHFNSLLPGANRWRSRGIGRRSQLRRRRNMWDDE